MKRRGRGEGSITLRRDGRWAGIINLGWQDGRRARRTLYGRTKAEVAKALRDALTTRDQGLPLPAGRLTVEGYLNRWLEHTKPSIRPRTYEKFESVVRLHIVPTLGKISLRKLEPDHVQDLLTAKLNAGMAAQSVRHIRTILSIALRRALRWNLTGRNVAALTDGPKVERTPIQPLDRAAVHRLLASLTDTRLEALYLTALTTAMRRGEVLGLGWRDVDLDARKLSVSQSLQRAGGKLQLLPLKTRSSTRTISLPNILVLALKRHRIHQKEEQLAAGPDWRGNPDYLVFTTRIGTALEPRNIDRDFKIKLAKAGLDDAKFHDLRHTCATLLFENATHPKQVQALLGHSRVSTTLDIYTHVSASTLDDTAARIDTIFAPFSPKTHHPEPMICPEPTDRRCR